MGRLAEDSITTLLHQDHEHIDELLEQVAACRSEEHDRRHALVEQIQAAITLHAEAEEEVLYRALEQDRSGAKLLGEARREHTEIARLLALLVDCGEVDTHETLRALIAAVRRHVHAEETDIFDVASSMMSELDLEELGRRFCERKKVLRVQLGIQRDAAPADALPAPH